MQFAQFGAKTALQPPERGDHGRRHAIFLFGAVERSRMHPDSRLRILCRAVGGAVSRKFGEYLAEHALAAVAVDDALVVGEVRGGRSERALRHAFGDGPLLQVGQETVERLAIMAGGGAGRGGPGDRLAGNAGGRRVRLRRCGPGRRGTGGPGGRLGECGKCKKQGHRGSNEKSGNRHQCHRAIVNPGQVLDRRPGFANVLAL